MFRKANERISPLDIRVGGFVYLHEDAVGQGRKLQANHSGPYTVDEIQSPHLIKLRDPEGKRIVRMPLKFVLSCDDGCRLMKWTMSLERNLESDSL
jgi:hypothetical protein